jgi:hypothetical protein
MGCHRKLHTERGGVQKPRVARLGGFDSMSAFIRQHGLFAEENSLQTPAQTEACEAFAPITIWHVL